MRIRFNDNKKEYQILSIGNNGNIVTVIGEIPENTSGFVLLKDTGTKKLDFSGFMTIYRRLPNGYQFSCDGSIATKTVVVSASFDDGDNYKGIRPASIHVRVKGVSYTLSEENGWKVEFPNVPIDDNYPMEFGEVAEYTREVNGTIAKYSTDYILPEVPSNEDRITDLENALMEIFEMLEA